MSAKIGVKATIVEAWESLKAQPKQLAVFFVALFAIQIIMNMISGAVGDNTIVSLLVSLVKFLLNIYVGALTIKAALMVVRRQPLTLDAFKGWDRDMLVKYLVTSIIYGLIVMGGCLLLIVPGIIWGIMYTLASYLSVDQRLGFKEALAKSKELTQGHKMELFLLGLALIGLNILGMIVLLVGLIITIPVTMLTGAVVYIHLVDNDSVSSTMPVKVKKEELSAVKPVKIASSMNDYQI